MAPVSTWSILLQRAEQIGAQPRIGDDGIGVLAAVIDNLRDDVALDLVMGRNALALGVLGPRGGDAGNHLLALRHQDGRTGTLEKDRPGTDRSHGTVFSGKLSPWGHTVYRSTIPYRWGQVPPTGTWIIANLGWLEWKDRLVGQNPPATLQQQYTCHAYYGYFVVGAGWHWDIELLRRSNPDWNKYPWSLAEHKCNW